MVNPWQVLGIPVGADKAVAKKAYRLLAKKNHPDVGGDTELFKQINEAWAMIEKGIAYDAIPKKRDILSHETLFTFRCV